MISSYLQPGARKLEGCVRSNAIENDNRSWWLPWQHLSIIFITVLTTAHVPSTLNGYSWFLQFSSLDYSGVCMGVGSDCSMKCTEDAAACRETPV